MYFRPYHLKSKQRSLPYTPEYKLFLQGNFAFLHFSVAPAFGNKFVLNSSAGIFEVLP